MTNKEENINKTKNVFIILGIIFVSFNLRAPITAVGSLAEMIKSEYMMSSGALGFITTLPLLTFAIVSPFVAKLYQKLEYGKTMALGLVLILIGELVRSYTNLLGLFIGTALIGTGIAIGNVLIPSIIKLKFPHKVGMVTSVYTTSMMIFAAVGAGVSIPLAKGLNLGWRNALASWFILTALTLLIWSPQLKATNDDNNGKNKGVGTISSQSTSTTSIWKSPIAWWVTLFMGTQSFLFYSLVAWLPTIIVAKGMADSFAGTMALTFQLMAIPATLIIPTLCDRFKNQRGLVLITILSYITGMSLFLFGQTETLILIAVVLMSLGMGGSISLSIAFISLRSPNSARASELSGMSQSAGYIFAAIGPMLMGLVYDVFSNWSIPIAIFGILIIILGFCGWFAGNDVVAQE